MSAGSDALDALAAEITRDADVDSSASTLIASLAQQVADANAISPQAVTDLVAKLRAQSDTLAAAVAANTPGQPPPDARKGR